MQRIRLLLALATLGVAIGGCGLFTLTVLAGRSGPAPDPFLGAWVNLENTRERLYIKKQDGAYLVRRGDKTYRAAPDYEDHLSAQDPAGEGPVGFLYERKYGFLSGGYGDQSYLYVRDPEP